MNIIIYGPAHDKTYNKTCVTSKYSDQPVHPPCLARVLIHPPVESPWALEGTWDQQRLWLNCMDVQVDISLCWSHKSYCRFCCVLALIYLFTILLLKSEQIVLAIWWAVVEWQTLQILIRGCILIWMFAVCSSLSVQIYRVILYSMRLIKYDKSIGWFSTAFSNIC